MPDRAPEPAELAIGAWYAVVDGPDDGKRGVLMEVVEASFGRIFLKLVVVAYAKPITVRLCDARAL